MSITPNTKPAAGLQNTAALIGRLFVAALFLPAGWGKLTGHAGTAAYITAVGMPMPEIGAWVAAAVEILCSIALIAGFQTRVAALVLGVFTMIASFFFHNYWAADQANYMAQYLNFYKNVAIFGGLLSIFAWGAGAFSVDAGRKA